MNSKCNIYYICELTVQYAFQRDLRKPGIRLNVGLLVTFLLYVILTSVGNIKLIKFTSLYHYSVNWIPPMDCRIITFSTSCAFFDSPISRKEVHKECVIFSDRTTSICIASFQTIYASRTPLQEFDLEANSLAITQV